MPSRSPKPLYDLLLALYRSNDNLFVFLATYPYSKIENLLAELPGTNVPRTAFTMQAVGQIQAHGLDNAQFFDSLIEAFPGRSDLIETAKKDYFGAAPAVADKVDDVKASAGLGPTPSAELTNTFEKIMGDRPTFLDVAYLAVGYQRAKSVAKLRMKFANGWYAGTAFLVAPDTLFTAHHNLWTGDKRAEEVEVIFDYERSVDGPDMEGIVLHPDPETFAGNAAEDWAVLKLREPQSSRPLAPLSGKPAIQGDRVAIIQHPSGMLKQVALHHNLVTYANETLLQYLTDTLPGSSGSPVFDGQWNVVAVHHAGGHLEQPGKKEVVYVNEGVPIKRVVAGLPALGINL